MAALVAPGVARFAVNGTYAGQPVVNILDMRIDTTGTTTSREDACFDQCGTIINMWEEHILSRLIDDYVATSVSWVDLNSLSGSTGERTTTDDATFPAAGTATGDPMPGNVAYKIKKETNPVRGQRQGRMYLAGVSENATAAGSPNAVSTAFATSFSEMLADFLDGINHVDSGIFDYDSRLCVVHTVDDVYVSSSDVTALTLEERLGSQRRRLDL